MEILNFYFYYFQVYDFKYIANYFILFIFIKY